MANLSRQEFDDLDSAIEFSNRILQYRRDQRNTAIKQFVGKHYASAGSEKKQPVNGLALMVFILLRLLAPHSPRAMFSSVHDTLKATAADFELAVNDIIKEINLDKTFRRFVLEALFSMGILKVGLHTTDNILGHSYGEVFVDNVTPDHFFIDMSAKTYDAIQFMGNDYWITYKDMMDSDYFQNKEGLEPDEFEQTGIDGNPTAQNINVNETATEFRKRKWLRDVWLPGEGKFITYSVLEKRRLAEFEWTDNRIKPYILLGYGEVPGNFLPLSPVSLIQDLDELGNALYRKLGTGADAQKSVLGFQGDDEGVITFKQASDGDGIKYNGPEPKRLEAGGINQATLAFYMLNRDQLNYFAGNLSSLGGLASQTQTLGQDRLISEAASAQIRDMSQKTIEAMRELYRTIAYYEWNDPLRERILQKPIPGLNETFPIVWGPESKVGEFDLFDLDIDPYSAQENTPSIQLQKLGFIVDKYVIPFLPIIEAQNGQFDIRRLHQEVAKLSNMPVVGEIVTWPEVEKPIGDKLQRMPRAPQDKRPIVNAGMTPRGQSEVLQRVLMGANPQKSEITGEK